MTGPTGGLLAIAGAGATIFACCRGKGTMRRGAGTAVCAGAAVEATGAGAATLGGVEATGEDAEAADGGGAATTKAGREGGVARTTASACFRSRIALSASPGLETLERSNFGLLSTAGRLGPVERPPDLK